MHVCTYIYIYIYIYVHILLCSSEVLRNLPVVVRDRGDLAAVRSRGLSNKLIHNITNLYIL